MQDLYNQVINEIRSAWRFRWWALGVSWLICILGWLWVISQPDIYRASARVFIDNSSDLRPLLSGQIVEQDLTARLLYVRQTMLARAQLEDVARKTGLDAHAMTPDEKLAVVEGLRTSIQIDSAGGSRNSADNIYQIRYQNRDRQTAIDVVETLLNAFVENTLGASREGSANARRFLEEQVAEYEQRLARAENELATFRRKNFDRLPGSEGGYFERLQAESQQLEQARKQLNLAYSKRDRIRQRLRGEVPASTDVNFVDDPAGNTLAQRIRENEARLEELLLRFTPKHPDVVATQETLEQLRQRRAEELAILANRPEELGPIASNNPVFQALQISLNDAEVEIATLEADVNDRQRSVDRLQSLIDEVPAVEAQLAQLNRDYDVVNAQYQGLVQSLERERLSREANESDRVQFRVVEPPFAEFQPVAPDRPRLLAMVLFAAFAVGGGLSFVFAQLRPVFHTAKSLRDYAGLPVLGTVSFTYSPQQRLRRRLAVFSFCMGCAALVALFVVVLAFEVNGGVVAALSGRGLA